MTDITEICFLRPNQPDGTGISAPGAHAASIDSTQNNPQVFINNNDFGVKAGSTAGTNVDVKVYGTLSVNDNPVTLIQPPTEITFNDDQSVTHTLKFQGDDVTATQHGFAVNFQLEVDGLKTYGMVLATYDGTTWHGHPTLYGVEHEHIGYSFSTVNGKVALTLAGSGSGNAASFKYAISKPFGTL